ncbi:alpha-L-rhamnosidase [Arachidicoccus rhizosphaerae]|uniref:Alpha-L-rhamnosidase n=1 Tax=Arachidicoccus rhizosphaerae TaxID=551991 RepID=A0A1H3VNC8_9BACT|nr:glycosyl hydrolase [Arachidicoccus rhizosphaerae]SDZ76307.1 alpha-L-rhamnosidase [Arachidicoccus rhizosphaerae]
MPSHIRVSKYQFSGKTGKIRLKRLGALMAAGLMLGSGAHAQLSWPAVTRQNKPWARWWWEGSAVSEKGLSDVMHLYKDAGLGGLEVTPIYGVNGEESKNIPFLSKRWMEVFDYTLSEGKKLDLGIDLANATGWPFGGPWVTDADASKSLEFKKYDLQKGQGITAPITFKQEALVRGEHRPAVDISLIKDPIRLNGIDNLQKWALDQVRFPVNIPLVALMAYDRQGNATDLADLVDKSGHLNWQAPEDGYQVYAIFQGLHGKMVERAAPGGEGFVIDHFSTTALGHYLGHFDSAFNGSSLDGLRGFFNDSYEVDDAAGQADFTPGLFSAFKELRGYDLKQYLPELLDKNNTSPEALRVLSDYRQTIGELLLEHFTKGWQNWGQQKGKLIRNQSHGSPANILDLYAAVDIPETEGEDELRFKFASSAADVMGKPLTSSESATWLQDHFLSSLADVKKAIDLYFLGGVNHVFYHGVAYSPLEATWPGWLFYAAVHFQPTNPQWKNFTALNEYIAHCQSFLQSSTPDNDILQYFPIFDSYAKKGRSLLNHYDGMKGFEGTDFKANAEWMNTNGYSFDFISDRQIASLGFDGSNTAKPIKSPGGHYQTLLLSGVDHIPEQSFTKILDLAKAGATILVYNHLPTTVNGLSDLDARQKVFSQLLASLNFKATAGGIQKASLGKGAVLLGSNLADLLQQARIRQEQMGVKGRLGFIRKVYQDGHYYFINNRSDSSFEGYVNLADDLDNSTASGSYALFSPMQLKSGLANVKNEGGRHAVFLQLRPWESVIVRTSDKELKGEKYAYTRPAGPATALTGNWKLTFNEGGPTLPKAVTMSRLDYWTNTKDTNALNFSGTATYELDFKKPAQISGVTRYRLRLGSVKENASIWLNGQKIATLIGPDFTLDIDAKLLKDNNHLAIRVSNLMANRIHYMDKNGLVYKRFYNINFPAHDAQNRGKDGLFTTLGWDIKPSGLAGPVTLTPLKTTP